MLPVKLTNGNLVSFAICLPNSAPPQTKLQIAVGNLFALKTSETKLVTAIEVRGVVGALFQI